MMTMSIRQRPVRAAALADVSVFDTDFFDDSFDDDADQHSGHSTRTPSPAKPSPSLGCVNRFYPKTQLSCLGCCRSQVSCLLGVPV